jgi:hypothetical protein
MPGIHVFLENRDNKDVDGRDEPDRDGFGSRIKCDRYYTSFSPFKLAWPSLPTMMWSCTEIPSGLATAMICCVI